MPRRNRKRKSPRRFEIKIRRKTALKKNKQACLPDRQVKTLTLSDPRQKKSKKHLSTHHRQPRSKGGLSTPENLSMVDERSIGLGTSCLSITIQRR